jgi:CRISPR-associated protein Cas4
LEQASLVEKELVSSIAEKIEYNEVYTLYTAQYVDILRELIEVHSDGLRSLHIEPEDAYYHALPSLMREAESRALNTFSFFEKTGLLEVDLWKALTPKILSEVKIESEELQLVGVIDQVHDYGAHVVPVELKTGRMPKQGVWPGHRIQACAYALMLGEQGTAVQEAIVHYLDGNEQRKVMINPFMKEEILQLVGEVRELLNNTLLPEYCNSEQKCSACGLRRECYNEGLMQSLLLSARMPAGEQMQLV